MSQQTFDAVFQRFKNGNTLIQAWADYNPGNANIKKAALTAFITSIDAANTSVTGTETDLNTVRGVRNPLVFEIEATNPTCLETRIRGIVSYLSSDPDNNAFTTSGKQVKT